jgi:molybdenum cofactor synthesis domain-containing protein
LEVRELKQFTLEIIAVGNELLIGKIADTNSQWIARRTVELGGKVNRVTVIPDDVEVISSTVKEALNRQPDFLLTIGGLGPTYDDKTLQGVAEALEASLKLNEEALRMIEEKVKEMSEKGILKKTFVTPERIKMATLPEGGKPIYNPAGTAPGVLVTQGKTVIICLPGVPVEMKTIFDSHISKLLAEKSNLKYAEVSFKVENLVESELSPILSETAKNNPQVYIKSHPKGVETTSKVEIHLSVFAQDAEEAGGLLKKVSSELKAKIEAMGGKVLEAE